MGLACGTILGCAVYMPLTSVQISKLGAFSTWARMAAVKSEPPRPSVVFSPALLRATNPGTKVILALVHHIIDVHFLPFSTS